MGIEQLKKVVEALAEAINVGYKLFNKAGIFVIFELSDDLSALSTLNKDQLIQEFKDLNEEERKELNSLFKSKLSLPDKVLEVKLESGADCLEDAVHLVIDGINSGKAIYGQSKALYEKVKELLAR